MTLKTYMSDCDSYFTQCAIVNPDGSVLANSGDVEFSEEELLNIFVLFTKPDKTLGSTIERKSQQFLIIHHKTNQIIARRYNCGIVAVRCKNVFIVAYHNESIETGVCANAIVKLGESLENAGF